MWGSSSEAGCQHGVKQGYDGNDFKACREVLEAGMMTLGGYHHHQLELEIETNWSCCKSWHIYVFTTSTRLEGTSASQPATYFTSSYFYYQGINVSTVSHIHLKMLSFYYFGKWKW